MILDVGLDQPSVVHFVDVVAGKNHDVFWTLALDRIDILIDGVSRSLVPVFIDALLRRHNVDELAKFALKVPLPTEIHVPIETHRLVLGEHEDFPDPAVEDVGKREIDDPISAAKRNRRFRPVAGKGFKTRTFSTGQNDGHGVFREC